MGPIMAGRPMVRYDPALTNVVFVGNSLVVGDGVTSRPADTWPVRLAVAQPINGALSIANLGHDGNSIGVLDGVGDTSAQFVAGKTNVLLFYEGTNSMNGGGSASAAISAMQSYITNRLAEHPWKIVLISTIPFHMPNVSDATCIGHNQQVDLFNAAMKANYKAWGATAYIDVRTGAPWGSMPDYTLASFQAAAVSALFSSDLVHPNTAGTQLLADLTAPQLRRIPLR